MISTQVNIPGYQVRENLYDGSQTIVYRALRDADLQQVVIKLLKNPHPHFGELLQFRNQYTIAKNLNFPGIIQTYSLECFQNGYILVMEDFGGISLKDYFIKNSNFISLLEFLQIAISLCETLNILYCQRVLHKDIKPSNILINPITKQVKLIDFSIASLLPRETESLKSPKVLSGTLSYLSPEQTGRMNRVIDYRTDFYSLGVTFYELLTGQLPFPATDPMELVHCHIAKMPTCVSVVKPDIPQAISDIISKLMAKNAEERYQSALGLKYDLEQCLYQITKTGTITDFEIATRDICDRFTIPEKLYGRENELEALLNAFERTSNGASELMLVAGFSGIGKTAVVHEVHKPIVKQRGYFIQGKFDQFNKNIPFSAFVQSFRDLMGQLLTESEAEIQKWRQKILTIVGDNGQILVDVIPELSRVIGQQPPVIELSGTAAENRFNLLFQKFVRGFTNKSHPLVIFLDDLQWADSASLKLIQLLMSESEQGYLLLIGAYRDNEVSPVHPLMLMLDEIKKNGAVFNQITLKPLDKLTLNQLVADTLKCRENLALSLTKLVFQKTKGNPFFATQFLKALHQDGLIEFNYNHGHWQCDITRVTQQALTDDVVEFMMLQLKKLPDVVQNILKLAACIGNQFDLETLAIVTSKSAVEIAACLWEALQSGLILPTSEIYKFYLGESNENTQQEWSQIVNYKFLHDRVQQAAYSLIPKDQKRVTHLKIGQLLLEKLSEQEKEEKLFDIIEHLNKGQELITQAPERETLAQLNLAAGQKAKKATAYKASKVYLQTGINLLTKNCWSSQYELTLNLYVAAAESAYLNGEFESMEQIAAIILQSAQTILDKVKIYEIQINALTSQTRMLEAIAAGQNALAQLGIEFSVEANETLTGITLQSLSERLQNKQIEELVNLSVMSNPQTIAAMQLLALLFLPIFQANPALLPLLSCTMVNLSLEFGNAPASTIGYAGYGMVLSAFLGEVEKGYRIGQVALSLLNEFNAREFKSITLLLFGAFILHRTDALRQTIPISKQGYLSGMETGDFLYAGYNITVYFYDSFFAGVCLDDWEIEIENFCVALTQVKQSSPVIYMKMVKQTVQNLKDTVVEQVDLLNGSAYDENEMLPKHFQGNELTALASVYIYKLMLAYLFGNYANAINYITQINNCLMAVVGAMHTPVFHFYASLTYLAISTEQPEIERANTLALAQTHQNHLVQWARYASMNHQHKLLLIEAETCRVLNKNYEAGDCYDRAIAIAKKNEFLHEEALANELTARFYLGWGREKMAQTYMQEAYYCYAKWGATAKNSDLEKRYPQLLQPILQQQQIYLKSLETIGFAATYSSTGTSSISMGDVLDFTSILKAAQTISSSIELDELVTSLTKIILKNSGAKKAVLILPEKNIWQVKAITFINHQNDSQIESILKSQSLLDCQDIPRKIINYVLNTQETVVIDNCQTAISGIVGKYILKHQPKSILCTPIIDRGHLIGILYLENKLTSRVFTQERLQVINLLSSQAAIALENARLYQEAQQALCDLQQAQLQIVQSEKMSALGNLVAGVAHEMNNPLGFISATLKQSKPIIADITEHLKLYQEKLPNPDAEILNHAEEIDLDYSLEDLPKMIDAMTMACDRLKNISTSLRTFSRADKDYKVAFNIHEGIDSTILILKHRLKANEQRPAIEVITNYGDLPQVQCFPGQLNQVFMNILANAIDALDESNIGLSFAEIQANPNKITVTTVLEESQVKILIADNGKGMSSEIKQKIFDHLFTTKAVSKGTGLGLAIARQIIEETHGGKLSCESVLGKGTEFIIVIPL